MSLCGFYIPRSPCDDLWYLPLFLPTVLVYVRSNKIVCSMTACWIRPSTSHNAWMSAARNSSQATLTSRRTPCRNSTTYACAFLWLSGTCPLAILLSLLTGSVLFARSCFSFLFSLRPVVRQMHMMGYNIDWASFNVVEVMSSKKFSHKRIGYVYPLPTFFSPFSCPLSLACFLLAFSILP